jgi:hypothetical protein
MTADASTQEVKELAQLSVHTYLAAVSVDMVGLRTISIASTLRRPEMARLYEAAAGVRLSP